MNVIDKDVAIKEMRRDEKAKENRQLKIYKETLSLRESATNKTRDKPGIHLEIGIST